jgi:hypothetical protein
VWRTPGGSVIGRLSRLGVGLVLSLLPALGHAQGGAELPEGHPSVSPEQPGTEATGNDEGSGEEPAELPEGHPPVEPAAGTPGSKPDSAVPDPSLAPGTVVVEALDAQDHGISGLDVELEVTRESVREGHSRVVQTASTREDGSARFGGLASDAAERLRARIRRGSATFASPAFALGRGAGTRVELHVYPTTSDVDAAQIGSVAKIYVLPQDQAFVVEAMFSIANVGTVAWVASDVTIDLPTGAEAFDVREGPDTLAVVRDDQDVARLRGTVGPGVHSVVFSFQVPRREEHEQDVQLGMPPRLMQVTVIAESAPGMTLAVRGLPPATVERSDDGRRVLVTGARIAGSGASLPKALEIRFGGLPVTGPGRWVALLAALGFVLGGVVVRNRRAGGKAGSAPGLHGEEVEMARQLILDELEKLEEAHARGGVGPRTYEQARRELVDALARLEPAMAAR